MHEDLYLRCARCDVLLAAQDAQRCGFHETDGLCPVCYRAHVSEAASNVRRVVPAYRAHADADVARCWVEVPLPTLWR